MFRSILSTFHICQHTNLHLDQSEMKSEIKFADSGSIRVFILTDQDWLYWSS